MRDIWKNFLTVGLGSLLLLVAIESTYAKEWRGIVPLRSTRADVIRQLSQCFDQKEACRFTLEREKVYILFSGGLGSDYECTKKVEPETVMFIGVEPTQKLRFKDLRLDKRKLKSFDFGRDLKGYATPDGFLVRVFKEEVLQLDYIVDEVDRDFCGNYYDPRSFVGLSHSGNREELSSDCFSATKPT